MESAPTLEKEKSRRKEVGASTEETKNKAREMAKIIFPPSSDRTPGQEAALLQRPEILKDKIRKAEADIQKLRANSGGQQSTRQLEYLQRIIRDAQTELGYIETIIARESEGLKNKPN